MSFVEARMTAMRVDTCSKDIKKCLESDLRCGPDYSQCIGMDLASIQLMCPPDSFTGCQGKDDLDYNNLLQGIYLGLDNAMLDQCQKLVDEKMIELCGDNESCPIFSEDTVIGIGSLASTRAANGDNIIDGLINFSNVKLKSIENGASTTYNIDVNEYINRLSGVNPGIKSRIQSTLNGVAAEVQRCINTIASDTKIDSCINGRDMPQIRQSANPKAKETGRDRGGKRFPNLLNASINVIANVVLDTAKENYEREYAKMFAAASSQSREYQNQIYCSAMATRGEYRGE